MKKIKKIKENLSRNEMKSINAGSEPEQDGWTEEAGGGGYCAGICGYFNDYCSARSGYGDCTCTGATPVSNGFCKRHG